MKKGIIVAILIVIANTAQGACIDKTDCYCQLKPTGSESLVYAEVTTSSPGSVDIKLLEDPFKDPSGELRADDNLTGIDNSGLTLQVQDKGLFRLTMGTPKTVAAVVLEVGEVFPCNMDENFPGATKEDVVAAVLAQDCHYAVEDMGVNNDCNDSISSCSACGTNRGEGTAGMWFLMFSLLTILIIRRAGGSAHKIVEGRRQRKN